MASFTPLSNHLSSRPKIWTLQSSKECELSFRCKQTAESWPEESALCVGPYVCSVVVWFYQYIGFYIPTALDYMHQVAFLGGVWSLGCTSFCLSVLLGLKNTGMCLSKILQSFSDTPDTYGKTMLLCLFFLLSTTTELVFLLECVAVFTKVQLG